jgi:hypothetical protein
MSRILRTASECLVKAAEMDRASDDCATGIMAAEFEELGVYWRGLARLASRPDEATSIEAALDRVLSQPSIH